MKAALALSQKDRWAVYALNEATNEKLRDVIAFIGRNADATRRILLINNLVLFADDLLYIGEILTKTGVQLFAQCRSRDWVDRVRRCVPRIAHEIKLGNLQVEDYEALRNGIVSNAVAPAFILLSPIQQIEYLKRSHKQLLVLMKEATKQREFDKIIEDEFSDVDTVEARAAFSVVGLATIGKSPISLGELQAVLSEVNQSYDAERALTKLEGLVIQKDAYLARRHQIYVDHIFANAIEPDELMACIVGYLKYFTRFNMPVILKLGRQKGKLFKFLLNYNWLRRMFPRGRGIVAERVYSFVEREYQLDGHYWLQRGLFYRNRGQYEVARDYFEKSIQAYPKNWFARHALAQQKLNDAARASVPNNAVSTRDVDQAVRELNQQSEQRRGSDEYPLVTLSQFHPEVLVRWGREGEARRVAREYYERLRVFQRGLSYTDRELQEAMTNCLMLATTGKWKSPVIPNN